MLTRDPFQPPARHARPSRHAGRRVLAAVITSGILAGAALLAHQAAHAATRTELGSVVAHAATHAAERFTPSPAPLIPAGRYRAADGHVCRALAVFDAAGIPSAADLRNLAAAGLGATRIYRQADGQLIMAVTAGGSSGAQDTALQRLCGPGLAVSARNRTYVTDSAN